MRCPDPKLGVRCVDPCQVLTNNLELRIAQHQEGNGAKHTKSRLPVKLVYCEEFQRIDGAFYREKQVQGWSRKKKEALIDGMDKDLNKLAECKNKTNYNYHSCLSEAEDEEML